MVLDQKTNYSQGKTKKKQKKKKVGQTKKQLFLRKNKKNQKNQTFQENAQLMADHSLGKFGVFGVVGFS